MATLVSTLPRRTVFLDTETTGLSWRDGERLISVGCVEEIQPGHTTNKLHYYVNPARNSHPHALKVHGLTTEFLQTQPPFALIAHSLLGFLGNADIVIFNATFDVGFLNSEFQRLGLEVRLETHGKVICALQLARQLYPGEKNTLDVLMKRFGLPPRGAHSALEDAEILQHVYHRLLQEQDKQEQDKQEQDKQERLLRSSPPKEEESERQTAYEPAAKHVCIV